MKKYTPSVQKSAAPLKWCVIDADGMVLGRLATAVADRLRGKRNVFFTPHVDSGDGVIILNADKIVLTGRKMELKKYYRHSGYMGGLKTFTAREMMQKKPEDVIRFAVRGMLPKNRLGRHAIRKLKIYRGAEHPHQAQQPEPFDIASLNVKKPVN